MNRKTIINSGLQFTPVWFEDRSLTSPDYLQISEFPSRLTAGKNLFKLRGHPSSLRVGGILNIEILDYNGNPIYFEVLNYLDDDKSRVIAIYIYEDTAAGDCTITIVAEAVNVPSIWQRVPNIKWSRSVSVNPQITNDSEIIFEVIPEITISEQIGPHLNRIYNGALQFPTQTAGVVNYISYNGQSAIELSGSIFTKDMVNGTLTVNTPNNPTPTAPYTISTTAFNTTIKKVLSPTLALLDNVYEVYTSSSLASHTYTAFDASSYSLLYETTPTYVETQNSESYALVEIKGLQPSTGDVSRVKLFMNNNGTVGTWELINDVELTETEIFVANSASIYPDTSIGLFTTQSIINTYWEGHTYQGRVETTPPTLTQTTASLNDALQIVNAIDISAKNAVSVAQIKSSYNGLFVNKSEYKITFDALGTKDIYDTAVLSIYVSGSAFTLDYTDYLNQELPVYLGKRIGQLTSNGTNRRFDDTVFSFIADYTGTGTLLFVVESGDWQISDIHTTSDNEIGYTPNYSRIKTLVPTAHKSNNQISFKTEYYNVAGVKSKQISAVYNKLWEGGNRYIDGNYSMLTGSLYVADSLDSGIAITGDKNTGFVRSLGYVGFNAGFPGFLLWSGSAMSGSLGTKGGAAYSGVGLEMYANSSNYFRYSTTDNELDIRTNKIFIGNASTFISASNGNLQISSSAFIVNANGSVTASSFIARSGSLILFDSNAKYADAFNIGRIVYFDKNESTISDLSVTTSEATAATMSVFQTFVLPGETAIGASFTYKHINSSATGAVIRYYAYIQSASIGPITDTSGYGAFSTPERITPVNGLVPGTSTPTNTTSSGAFNINLIESDNTVLTKYWGKYVQIYLTAYTTNTSPAGSLNLKNFVFKSSRVLASITTPYSDTFPPILTPDNSWNPNINYY